MGEQLLARFVWAAIWSHRLHVETIRKPTWAVRKIQTIPWLQNHPHLTSRSRAGSYKSGNERDWVMCVLWCASVGWSREWFQGWRQQLMKRWQAVVEMGRRWCWEGRGAWVCGLPECGARRGRWKRVGGPATAPPGTAGMTPTRLGCWDIEQALWAHLWKEEEEEWSEESGQWTGEWLERQGGGGGRIRGCGGAVEVRISYLK